MRFTAFLFFCLPFFCWQNCPAQDSSLFVLVEAGVHFIGCEQFRKDYIRDDNSSPYFSDPRIINSLGMAFAGGKVEKITNDERWAFSGGLRYTYLTSSIAKSGIPEFFYLMLRQSGTTTEYLKVKEITETSHYLGIPFEVKFYTGRNGNPRWYFMVGGEWSYQLGTATDIAFHKPEMRIYESDVQKLVGPSSASYASLCLGSGVLLGKERPEFCLGVHLPVIITKTVSSLNTAAAGGGIHIQYFLLAKDKKL